mmetsp:Transcript_21411/g.32643  ORF Transcript_21411/g.32643 Transcript_21411/m.32643 type:complete len:351 (+) Transcript_21411:1176-2228(+)
MSFNDKGTRSRGTLQRAVARKKPMMIYGNIGQCFNRRRCSRLVVFAQTARSYLRIAGKHAFEDGTFGIVVFERILVLIRCETGQGQCILIDERRAGGGQRLHFDRLRRRHNVLFDASSAAQMGDAAVCARQSTFRQRLTNLLFGNGRSVEYDGWLIAVVIATSHVGLGCFNVAINANVELYLYELSIARGETSRTSSFLQTIFGLEVIAQNGQGGSSYRRTSFLGVFHHRHRFFIDDFFLLHRGSFAPTGRHGLDHHLPEYGQINEELIPLLFHLAHTRVGLDVVRFKRFFRIMWQGARLDESYEFHGQFGLDFIHRSVLHDYQMHVGGQYLGTVPNFHRGFAFVARQNP